MSSSFIFTLSPTVVAAVSPHCPLVLPITYNVLPVIYVDYLQNNVTITEKLRKRKISVTFWKIITARKRSLRRLCFYRCLSVHTGGCAWLLPGGHAWLFLGGAGHAWWCSWGHAWLLWGHAWLLQGGVHCCRQGGMHGCSWGACVVAPGGGACMGYDEIQRYNQ